MTIVGNTNIGVVTMQRTVPLRLLLICCLLWGMLTVAFSSAALHANQQDEESDAIGKAILAIAEFPATATIVIDELYSYVTGDYRDEAFRVPREAFADFDKFEPLKSVADISVEGLIMRVNRANYQPGWRYLVGGFILDGTLENAVVLVSPDLKIVKTWPVRELSVGDAEIRAKHLKMLHGFAVTRDASMILSYDGGATLQKIDRCGNRSWNIPGQFHHAVTLDDTGETVWSLMDSDKVVQIDAATGKVLKTISMDDVIASNPGTDVLELRRLHGEDLGENARNTTGKWLEDNYHFNDVEPLPGHLAGHYDGFKRGDLLISSRSLNLVFVLDPETLKIKWWRIGASQRQHDPDWSNTGEITVFNNRMSRDYSEVISIDPQTFAAKRLVDGRKHTFYTRIRGRHQVLPNGRILVTSPQQGRAFELDKDGEVVLEIVNTKPGSKEYNLAMTELKWLPQDAFNLGDFSCANTN